MGMLETVAILFFNEEEYRSGVMQEAVDNFVDTPDMFPARHGSLQYFQKVKYDSVTRKRKVTISREREAVGAAA